VPAVDPDRAHEIVADSGCRTADVTVAPDSGSLAGDLTRLEAVRDALGPQGAIRCDANGMWDVDTAVAAIAASERAAGGLEYVAQPCRTSDELTAVRRRVDVPVATTVPVRAGDPLRASLVGAADVAILRTGPLGGARRALMVADACGLPCVVSSALETSVGLSAGLALETSVGLSAGLALAARCRIFTSRAGWAPDRCCPATSSQECGRWSPWAAIYRSHRCRRRPMPS
jgi:O-succinylbenzoate synthase